MIVDLCDIFDVGTFLMWTNKALKQNPKIFRTNKILMVEQDGLIELDIISGDWNKFAKPFMIERTFVKKYVGDNDDQYNFWAEQMREWLIKPPSRNWLKSKIHDVYDYDLRRKLSKTFCFAMPSKEIIDLIINNCTSEYLLELGSGTGYWAAILKNHGLKVIATDIAKPYNPEIQNNKVNYYWQHVGYYHPTEQISGPYAVMKYPDYDVLMVWPSDHNEWPWHALRRVKPGNYRSLQTAEMPHWPFLYDYMEIFERNDNIINWTKEEK